MGDTKGSTLRKWKGNKGNSTWRALHSSQSMDKPLLARCGQLLWISIWYTDQMKGTKKPPKFDLRDIALCLTGQGGYRAGVLLLLMSMSPFSCPCYGFRSKELSSQNRAEGSLWMLWQKAPMPDLPDSSQRPKPKQPAHRCWAGPHRPSYLVGALP